MPLKEADHNLIEKCLKGDRQAQEQVYLLYYRAMYNISFRLLNDRMEAEDIMQEAFLAAFVNMSSWRAEVPFGAWLKRIVINKSIDSLRSRKLKFGEIDENTEYEVAEQEIEIRGEDESTTLRRIRNAMQQLPDGFRAVLSLFLFEGYDHSEIARIFNIRESTSRSQLLRAKKKLAEILNAEKK